MARLLSISTDRVTFTFDGPTARADVPERDTPATPGILEVRVLRSGCGGVEVGGDSVVGWVPPRSVGPRFFENTDYDVCAVARSSAMRVRVDHRDPSLLHRLREFKDGELHTGTLSFGSGVGLSRFVVLCDREPEFEVIVKVFPTKLDFETDREDMIEEIQRELGALALQWLGTTYGFGDVARGAPTDLEWTLLLRHALSDLERGLQEVARHPRRALIREPQATAAHRIRRVDNAVRSILGRPCRGAAAGTLSSGHTVPRRLPAPIPTPTLDTPEHRWFARRVGLIRRRLAAVQAAEASRRASGARLNARGAAVNRELAAIAIRLSRISELAPLLAASGPPPAGFSSLQLMTATGYGLAYRACMRLDLALRIQNGVVQLAEKGMDRLYEYWAFLRVVRGVEAATGGSADGRELLGIESGGLQVRALEGRQTRVPIRTGRGARVGVSYNPEFNGRELTLVAQRPDILVSYEEPGWPSQCLVVDAKYRLDASPDHLKRVDQPAPPVDALNVLYRYRDAILEGAQGDEGVKAIHTVVEAAAVYPYCPPDETAFRGSRLWGSLERFGVGAIPLLPGREAWLTEWLSRTLGRGSWSLADRALAHRSTIAAERHLRQANEVVLIGVVPRGHEVERLRWHTTTGRYFVPYRDVARLPATRWVALYAAPPGGGRGRVEMFAPVLACLLTTRSEIVTPWLPSRSPGEQVILYELGQFASLKRPIENTDGRRLSSHIWASYLSLMRARDLSELSLETVHEWRLRQQLLAEDIPFLVRSGDKSTLPGDERGGAALFAVAETATVRHCPNVGFAVDWWDGRRATGFTVEQVAAAFRRPAAGAQR
ncbi:MAG: DUF2357 domain-containing protein [Pseudomonadota bacterium]|nr:DUF2357 domain-containing protein [Pseudomonadota bacterium]